MNYIEYNGKFKAIEIKSRSVQGTIFKSNDKWFLRTLKPMEGDTFAVIYNYYKEYGHTVYGDLNGKKITLFGVFFHSFKDNEVTYSMDYLLFDRHVASPNNKLFKGISVTIPGHTFWINKELGDTHISEDGQALSYQYAIPENIKIPFKDGCTFEVYHSFSTNMGKPNFQLERKTNVNIYPAANSSITELLDISIHYLKFLSIIWNRKIDFESITLLSKVRGKAGKQLEHRLLQHNDKPVKGDKFSMHSFQLRYEEIKDHFPAIVENWYHYLTSQKTHLVNILYNFTRLEKYSMSDLFINCFQGVEGFGRSAYKAPEDNNFELRVSTIVDQIQDETDKAWIKAILANKNQPSIKEIFRPLVKDFLNELILHFIDNEKDIEKVLNNILSYRHQLTHPKDNTKPLPVATVRALSLFTKHLLIHLLLKETGVPYKPRVDYFARCVNANKLTSLITKIK